MIKDLDLDFVDVVTTMETHLKICTILAKNKIPTSVQKPFSDNIQDALKKTNVKISKLAQGLPVGGEIENLDDGTLISAFKNRQNF